MFELLAGLHCRRRLDVYGCVLETTDAVKCIGKINSTVLKITKLCSARLIPSLANGSVPCVIYFIRYITFSIVSPSVPLSCARFVASRLIISVSIFFLFISCSLFHHSPQSISVCVVVSLLLLKFYNCKTKGNASRFVVAMKIPNRHISNNIFYVWDSNHLALAAFHLTFAYCFFRPCWLLSSHLPRVHVVESQRTISNVC